MKFHALIDIGTVAVLEMDAAKDTAGDCPAMTEILGKTKDWKWDGRSDSATCPGTSDPLKDLGPAPSIKPKPNTASNVKGDGHGGMATIHMEGREKFGGRHHPRGVAEAVYAALKAMYGDSLRTQTPGSRPPRPCHTSWDIPQHRDGRPGADERRTSARAVRLGSGGLPN